MSGAQKTGLKWNQSPYNIMVAAAVAALACLVIVPLIEMVVRPRSSWLPETVRRVEGPRRGLVAHYWKKLLQRSLPKHALAADALALDRHWSSVSKVWAGRSPG